MHLAMNSQICIILYMCMFLILMNNPSTPWLHLWGCRSFSPLGEILPPQNFSKTLIIIAYVIMSLLNFARKFIVRLSKISARYAPPDPLVCICHRYTVTPLPPTFCKISLCPLAPFSVCSPALCLIYPLWKQYIKSCTSYSRIVFP